MSAQAVPIDQDLLAEARDPVEAAREHVAGTAFREGSQGRVGLELELHLVDLADPARRPGWDRVVDVVAAVPALPGGSTVSVEPGGQVELSTPPGRDVAAAVAALRADRAVLAQALAGAGLGAAPLGSDPARPPRRTNPRPRYAAMEQHFAATGRGDAGRAMMTATAALQVNLDAGPAAAWPARLAHLRALLPVLAAVSATSPYLGGRSSGWHSMRQQAWARLDPRHSGPVAAGPPAERWAGHVLAAPLMMTAEPVGPVPVATGVTFLEWLREPAALGRRATLADLDHHLTTLFPPLRPRGCYLEIRCLDALPDAWWPAVTTLTVVLADDPAAADLAADACAPLAGDLARAARCGMADPAVREAVRACTDIAVRHAPRGLEAGLTALAELAQAGRCLADELRERVEAGGALRLLEEEARA